MHTRRSRPAALSCPCCVSSPDASRHETIDGRSIASRITPHAARISDAELTELPSTTTSECMISTPAEADATADES
eukprot:5596229-Pleurochrysis_carterae.AAC.1